MYLALQVSSKELSGIGEETADLARIKQLKLKDDDGTGKCLDLLLLVEIN